MPTVHGVGNVFVVAAPSSTTPSTGVPLLVSDIVSAASQDVRRTLAATPLLRSCRDE